MSAENTVCGAIKKKSQLGISWNTRYLVVVGNHIKIYKTAQESKKQNGKCKYSFNITDTELIKKGEKKNQITVEISCDPQHKSDPHRSKYQLQIPSDLWKSLNETVHNLKNPTENINCNEEQKTQDTQSTEHFPTESNEFLPSTNINIETEQTTEEPKTEEIIAEIITDIIEETTNEDLHQNEEIKTEETQECKTEIEETIIQIIKYEWNKKYKSILDMNDRQQRHASMKEFLSEFCTLCKTQCIDLIENIISVHYATNGSLDDLNTFVRDEIEFKIIKCNSEYYEKKSLLTNHTQYSNAFDEESEKVYCPLSCIVEYLNYKIYCHVPICSDNLIFGKHISEDTFQFNETVSKLLDTAAVKLNLSSHACKYDKNVQISTTSNIRIYEENGAYFMNNISELYPVDTVYFVKNKEKCSNDMKLLTNTSRLPPKLVQTNAEPISSDAFIPPSDDKNDEIASKAIYNLHSNIIPKFAENINNLKIKVLDCDHFTQLMFDKGISFIYVGEVYNLCKIAYVKDMMGILMICQAIKHKMGNEFMPSQDTLHEKLKYFINCFANNDDSYKIEIEFKQNIISSVNKRYNVRLAMEEVNKYPINVIESELQRIFTANKQEQTYTFHPKITLSVPDQYAQCEAANTDMQIIQNEWTQLLDTECNVTDCDKFEEFRQSCLVLIERIDKIFECHSLKFDIIYTMAQTYLKIANNNTECSCALYLECLNLAKLLLGPKHRQTLSIEIQLTKLLYSNGKCSTDQLYELLKMIQSVFGRSSLHSISILKMLSDTHLQNKNYIKSIEFTKQTILILDEKKRFKHEQYINAHLQIALIAEKMDNHGLGLRFLNKLYKYVKKQMEKENKQKLWENLDVKIMCLSISRIKLKMTNKRKLNDLMKTWKAFHENKHGSDSYSMAEYNKYKELIIQNLCLNPIKKSNDLLKRNTENIQVICWINIIKEFEKLFLGVN